MGYNLLDERTEVNGDVSVDEELSKNSGKIEENNSLNVYDESYNNYDIIANNENDLGDKKSDDLQSDIDVNMRKNDEIGEGFDGDLGGDLDDDDDWDDEEELDENDPDYDWEHINFLKELKKSLDAIDERDAKELEERHKNGGLLDSQLVNYDDYEYEDFSEYDHLSNEEIDKMCGDMSDLDWDAIEEFWKTHKRGAPHILIDPVTREEIGTIYDTPSEEEEEVELARAEKKKIVLNDKDMYNSIWEFENVKDFPYLDSSLYITVGVGFYINKKDDFFKQNWYVEDNGNYRKATYSEIKKAYDYFEEEKKKGKKNRSADSFFHETKLRLKKEEIEPRYKKMLAEKFDHIFTSIEEYNRHVDEFLNETGKKYHKIKNPDDIPVNMLIGLMDLSYNTRDFYKYKKMWNAFAIGDYETAIKEAKRANPSNNQHVKKRNDWVEKRMREKK